MFIRSSRMLGLAALVSASLAGVSQGAFISFASDNASTGWSFVGAPTSGGFTLSSGTGTQTINLQIDDNNGPLPTLSIPVRFTANIVATNPTIANLGGSIREFNYEVSGSFTFTDLSGNALLTANIGSTGLMQIFGSQTGSNLQWGTSGSIQAGDDYTNLTYNWQPQFITALNGALTAAGQVGRTAADYGFVGTSSTVMDDFVFDLTVLNAGSPGIRRTVGSNGVPSGTFQSESSLSGSINIPAPGAAALLGGLMVVGARRRR